MKNLDWVWIGLVLGTQLQCPKVGADLTDAVDGWVLVNDLFAHMELWFLLICISLDKGWLRAPSVFQPMIDVCAYPRGQTGKQNYRKREEGELGLFLL
jgi:hypothetical protein